MFSKTDIIRSNKWSEPVQVDLCEEIEGGYVRILGVGVKPRNRFDQILSLKEISSFSIERQELNFTSDPESVFLAIEHLRYKLVSIYDPLLTINTSKVESIPFSIRQIADEINFINFIQKNFKNVKIQIIAEDGELDKQDYEDKINEILRQMGINKR